MSWLTQNLSFIFQLLPSFFTASIFYSLTPHPKASEFERVVEALVYSMLLKVIVTPIRLLLLLAGRFVLSLGKWSADTELVWLNILAMILGLLLSWAANEDFFYRLMRKFQLTRRTSFPSEWYSVLARHPRWVILHLGEGRRLYGWPNEWPDNPDKGHFVIDQPEWVMDDGSRIPISQTEKYLIPASEVKHVELLIDVGETPIGAEEPRSIQKPLTSLNRSVNDGGEAATAGPEPAPGRPDEHSEPSVQL